MAAGHENLRRELRTSTVVGMAAKKGKGERVTPKADVKFADPAKVRQKAREIAKRDRGLLDRLAK